MASVPQTWTAGRCGIRFLTTAVKKQLYYGPPTFYKISSKRWENISSRSFCILNDKLNHEFVNYQKLVMGLRLRDDVSDSSQSRCQCWTACNGPTMVNDIAWTTYKYSILHSAQVQHHIFQNKINIVIKRNKSTQSADDEDGDEENDTEDVYDETGETFPWYTEDSNAPDNFVQLKLFVKSTRVDSVVCKAFVIARNRIDDIFYQGRLIVNGEKVTKKGRKMEVGDYVDYCTETTDGVLRVKRVRLLKVADNKTKKNNIQAIARVWKKAFIIEEKEKRD